MIGSDRTCEFELKLMDIDSEHLGIPDTAYDAVVTLPSAEFQRICRDISVMSESRMNLVFILFSHLL